MAAKKHAMMIKINNLFDQWDAEKLGYLDKTEIIAVLSQWQKTSTKSYNIEMGETLCHTLVLRYFGDLSVAPLRQSY